MKRMKSTQIISEAQTIADRYTCSCGGDNAERILKLAWEKVKAKNDLLKKKYEEIEK